LKGKGFAAGYQIHSLDKQKKYHLVFTSAHPKAAKLASDIVNGVEENFQREVQEYRERRSMQPSLFSLYPTEEEIFTDKVNRLQDEIRIYFGGQTLKRADLHYKILCIDNKKWFGKFAGKHLTKALDGLQKESIPKIRGGGPLSRDDTLITVIK
jgi:hypothetical protein